MSNRPTRIDFFDGTAHDFLSNFHAAEPIEYDGRLWPTTEHAFQAMKTLDFNYRRKISLTKGPGAAKGLGQRAAFVKHGVELRPDWDTVKFGHMLDLLRIKFAQSKMRKLLLGTGDAELVEGNVWNDTCWGVEYFPRQNGRLGVGTNHLGRQLMRVRAEIRPQIRTMWQVTGIGFNGFYERTVECRTLAGVRRAAEKLAAKMRAPLLSPGKITAMFLGGSSDPRRIVGEGGSYVEVEQVK